MFFQDNGLVPIVEPEILLDGDHSIDRTLEVAEKVWAEVFYYLAENNVMFEGILLKPSMVTPGAEHKEKASPETIAKYTLTMLKRRVPPAVPGIMVRLLGLFQMDTGLRIIMNSQLMLEFNFSNLGVYILIHSLGYFFSLIIY